MQTNRKIMALCAAFFMICPWQRSVVEGVADSGLKCPAPISAAECVMELNSRRILYEHSGDIRLPMASTTKILTAITVLDEANDIQREISIPSEAVGVEGSSVYLKEGERYSTEDLLYGVMLRSGNDAATALALSYGKTIDDFAVKMNKTAQKAGAIQSNFVNPHGLPSKGHYTTAIDLSLIACYALQNETFAKIVSTKFYEPRQWQNKNKLLRLYDGAIGVKTGYTKQAGKCLVSAAMRENMTLVCTLLNCPQTYERTIQLFDDCFKNFESVTLLEKSETFEIRTRVKEMQSETHEEFVYPLRNEERELIERRVIPIKNLKKSVKKGEIVGQIEIYLLKRLLFSANLYKL